MIKRKHKQILLERLFRKSTIKLPYLLLRKNAIFTEVKSKGKFQNLANKFRNKNNLEKVDPSV